MGRRRALIPEVSQWNRSTWSRPPVKGTDQHGQDCQSKEQINMVKIARSVVKMVIRVLLIFTGIDSCYLKNRKPYEAIWSLCIFLFISQRTFLALRCSLDGRGSFALTPQCTDLAAVAFSRLHGNWGAMWQVQRAQRALACRVPGAIGWDKVSERGPRSGNMSKVVEEKLMNFQVAVLAVRQYVTKAFLKMVAVLLSRCDFQIVWGFTCAFLAHSVTSFVGARWRWVPVIDFRNFRRSFASLKSRYVEVGCQPLGLMAS